MAFELFNKKGGRTALSKITIAKAGYIGFNSSCMQKFFKNKSFVQLYWDGSKKTIGFKPLDRELDGAFKISSSSISKSGSIAGKSFLKYYEIDYSKSESYVPDWSERDGMLLVRL